MISQLAHDVIAQTHQYDILRKSVSQAQSVRDTEMLLDEIGVALYGWTAICPVIEPLFVEEEKVTIRDAAVGISRQLAATYVDFQNQNFQQAGKLNALKNRVDKLLDATKGAWTRYAQVTGEPYVDTMQIAVRLPKMERRLPEIQGYLASAQKFARQLPATPNEVNEFHRCLARLDTLLSDLDGLPSDVRMFWDKLMRGEATFADVTQTVFDWCRAEGLGEKLRIARL